MGDGGVGGFDMHIHSTASDGLWTPRQIVEYGLNSPLDGLAITDHDTVAGLAAGREAAAALHFPFIAGIEISAEWQDKDVHILGYWLDDQNPVLREKLASLQNARRSRCLAMADKLAEMGIYVDGEEIIAQAGPSVGRPHLAKALVEKGYAHTIKETFVRWLGKGMPAYVPRMKITPFEAIEMIRNAQGVPVLAHPGVGVPDPLAEKLAASGLGGIEVYHPEHDRRAEQHYLRMARFYRLAAMGGSDFHGSRERGIGSKTTLLNQLELLARHR